MNSLHLQPQFPEGNIGSQFFIRILKIRSFSELIWWQYPIWTLLAAKSDLNRHEAVWNLYLSHSVWIIYTVLSRNMNVFNLGCYPRSGRRCLPYAHFTFLLMTNSASKNTPSFKGFRYLTVDLQIDNNPSPDTSLLVIPQRLKCISRGNQPAAWCFISNCRHMKKKMFNFLVGFKINQGRLSSCFFSPRMDKELVFHLLTAKIIKLFSLLGL